MPPTKEQAAPETTADAGASQGAPDPFAGAALPGNEDPSGAVQSDAPASDAGSKPSETATAEPTETPAEPPEPETPEDGDKATPPTPETKVWAGAYKTPEELETAHKELATRYDYSSQEGRRLNALLKETTTTTEKTVSALQAELSELKAIIEAGPEIKEPTDEELEAMSNIKATRLLNSIAERKATLSKIKESQAVRSKEQTQAKEKLFTDIVSMARDMPLAKDKSGETLFPDYDLLTGDIASLMDYEPGVTGHAKSPVILYFAAYGRRALERDRNAKALTGKSKEAALAKAKAAATGAGAAGASGGGVTAPGAKGKQPAPGSDGEYNTNFINAHRARTADPLR